MPEDHYDNVERDHLGFTEADRKEWNDRNNGIDDCNGREDEIMHEADHFKFMDKQEFTEANEDHGYPDHTFKGKPLIYNESDTENLSSAVMPDGRNLDEEMVGRVKDLTGINVTYEQDERDGRKHHIIAEVPKVGYISLPRKKDQ